MAWLVRFTLDFPVDADRSDGPAAAQAAQAADLIMSDLWDAGTTGLLQADDGSIVAGFDTEVGARSAGRRLRADRPDLVESFTVEPAPAADRWEGDDRPTTVVVDTDRHRFDITIRAGGAFGHGAHPTTGLALDLLLASVDEQDRVLDVGTGTGVLAIAAAMAGAGRVTAMDHDPIAVAVATDNVARNNLARNNVARSDPGGNTVEVACSGATIPELVGRVGRFDVIVINVLLPVHRELAPDVVAALDPGGTLATAGYLTDQAEDIVALYRAAARSADRAEPIIIDRRDAGDWSGHRFRMR